MVSIKTLELHYFRDRLNNFCENLYQDEVESVEGEEEEVDNPEDAELTIDDDTDDTDIYTDITDNELDNFDDDNDSAPRNEYVIGVRRISGNATTR